MLSRARSPFVRAIPYKAAKMTKPIRTYSRETMRALAYLAAQISMARKERRFTEAEMAERAGISRSTLRAIEAGGAKVEIGVVLETAFLLGVPIFGQEGVSDAEVGRIRDRLALLPQAIRARGKEMDDDF
jgi:transcriptional regulator with XRE-family HTH domain